MKNGLKACPFCGGDANLNPQTYDINGEVQTWSICCEKCFVEKTYVADKEELIKEWNTRSK